MQMRLGFIGENSLEGVERDCLFAREYGFEGLEYNYWGEFADLTADTVAADARPPPEAQTCAPAMLGIWGWNHLSSDPAERARGARDARPRHRLRADSGSGRPHPRRRARCRASRWSARWRSS